MPLLSDICRRARAALDKWGREAQAFMICEETAELGAATAQFMRGRVKPEEVLDEAADGVIVSCEAAVLAGFNAGDLAEAVYRKLGRLDRRLADMEGHFGPDLEAGILGTAGANR